MLRVRDARLSLQRSKLPAAERPRSLLRQVQKRDRGRRLRDRQRAILRGLSEREIQKADRRMTLSCRFVREFTKTSYITV